MEETKPTNKFAIFPPDPPNAGILFINHEINGRSGHNGHSLIEYKEDHILAFYLNGSGEDEKHPGHHPKGWTEYKRSTDGGQTWGEPRVLEYSKQLFEDPAYFSGYIKETLLAPDGTIIAIGCRFRSDYPEFDKAFYIKSRDGGETWSEPLDFAPDDPVYGRPQSSFVHNDTLYVLFIHTQKGGERWGQDHPHRLYVSTDNGEAFARRSDLTLDTECWYGTMAILENGHFIAYAYRDKDEHHLQYVLSEDEGKTWSEPDTTYLAKKIRNPIMSEKLGEYYFMHGRSGQKGEEEARNLVLYSSQDGIHWDEGIFLNKSKGAYAYTANEVIGKFNPTKPPRLLIQSSVAYDSHWKVNVHHWWIDLM